MSSHPLLLLATPPTVFTPCTADALSEPLTRKWLAMVLPNVHRAPLGELTNSFSLSGSGSDHTRSATGPL